VPTRPIPWDLGFIVAIQGPAIIFKVGCMTAQKKQKLKRAASWQLAPFVCQDPHLQLVKILLLWGRAYNTLRILYVCEMMLD